MSGINKVIILGRIGNDVTVKEVGDAKVASFSMATSESWKDKNGEKKEKVEWSNIVVWRQLAEIAEKYLKKGSQLYVEGKLQTRKWEDKDGNTRYTTEIIGNKIEMLGGRSDNSSSGESVGDEGSDLPF